MAGLGGGKNVSDIESIRGVLISGKVPTTAAGGGSTVAITNISGDVRVTAGSLPIQVSVAGVTKVSGQIKVTAVGAGGGAVSITNVSGQIPVTAGNLPIPVTVAGQPVAVSLAAVKVSGNKLEVNIAGVNTSGGKILTTAAGGGTNVAITNVSGDIRVTAGNLPIPTSVRGNVSAIMQAQVNTSAPPDYNELAFGAVRMTSAAAIHAHLASQVANIGISAAALPQQDVSAHAFITNQPLVGICGVNTAGSALNVNIVNVSGQIQVTAPTNIGISAASLPGLIASISGDVRVTAGGAPIPVTVAGQPVAVSAAGAVWPVQITNVSGAVRVTAGDLPVPVTVGGQPIAVSVAAGTIANVSVGGAYLSAMDTATSGTRAFASAIMANTSATRLDMDRLEAAVTASALDVRATFSGVTAAAVTAAGGVPLPVNIVQTSAQIHVTAGNLGLPVIASVSGDVRVTAGNAPITVSVNAGIMVSGQIKTTAVGAGGAAVAITNVSGQIRVTAGDLPLPTLASISGNVKVTAGGLPLEVTAAGGSFAVSAQGGAITVSVQNEPLVDVCGVNRTGSAMNVYLAGVSAEVHVTAGGLGLPVVATVSGQVKVTAADTPLPVLASISGQVKVTGADLPISVSVVNEFSAKRHQVAMAPMINVLFHGQISSNPQYKAFSIPGNVCADIVAANPGARIKVMAAHLQQAGTANQTWLTTGAATRLWGPTPGLGYVLPYSQIGWFETALGSALCLQTDVAVSVGGGVVYAIVSTPTDV
jgi:hypothetical protein